MEPRQASNAIVSVAAALGAITAEYEERERQLRVALEQTTTKLHELQRKPPREPLDRQEQEVILAACAWASTMTEHQRRAIVSSPSTGPKFKRKQALITAVAVYEASMHDPKNG